MDKRPSCLFSTSRKIGLDIWVWSNTISAYAPIEVCNNGGNLLVELLPTHQLDVCHIHNYSEYSQRGSHQVSRFYSGLHSGRWKIRYIHGTSHMFWSWRGPPQIMDHQTRQNILWPKGFRLGIVWENQGRSRG